MSEFVTIKVDQAGLDKIKDFYSDYLVDATGDYIYFVAKYEGIVITGYSSKKEAKKVTFSGKGALKEARIFDNAVKVEVIKKEKVTEHWIDYNDQIGSDEVGVGDLCLPMIVVASYVKHDQIKRLIELGIHDSKKMTDEKIKEIGPSIVKEFAYAKLTLTNAKYNEMIAKGENINSLKAKMHNKALYDLTKENPEVIGVYVDQFVNEKKYYEYLKMEKHIVKDISFKTKGESYFPCVALASVIARYAFLLEKEHLEKKLGVTIPCGAGPKVESFIKEYLKTHTIEETNSLVKTNFKNYQEIIH